MLQLSPEKEIVLEYRDDYGRLLDRKGAWKEIGRKFHGHKVNKGKMAKILEKHLLPKMVLH